MVGDENDVDVAGAESLDECGQSRTAVAIVVCCADHLVVMLFGEGLALLILPVPLRRVGFGVAGIDERPHGACQVVCVRGFTGIG